MKFQIWLQKAHTCGGCKYATFYLESIFVSWNEYASESCGMLETRFS